VLFLAGCADKQETLPAAVENLDLKGAGVDEFNNGLVVVDLSDGSRVSLQDGKAYSNGEVVSCPELKTRAPFLLRPLGDRGPFLDADCQQIP
jgi:hypothetical protein